MCCATSLWRWTQKGTWVHLLCVKYISLSQTNVCERETKLIHGYMELEMDVMDLNEMFSGHLREMTPLLQEVQLVIPDIGEKDPALDLLKQ